MPHLRNRNFEILDQNPKMPKEATLGILKNAILGIRECRNRQMPGFGISDAEEQFSSCRPKTARSAFPKRRFLSFRDAILDFQTMPRMNAHVWHLQEEVFWRFLLQPVPYQNGHMNAKTWIRKGTFFSNIAQSRRVSLKLANITVPIENSVDCYRQIVRARGIWDFRTSEIPFDLSAIKKWGYLPLSSALLGTK
jgi:hypothetical protein